MESNEKVTKVTWIDLEYLIFELMRLNSIKPKIK